MPGQLRSARNQADTWLILAGTVRLNLKTASFSRSGHVSHFESAYVM